MGKPEIVHKTIAPISHLFTTDFMREISFKENGDATIKESLESYIVNYCSLFRSECNYVVDRFYCQRKCTGSIIGNIATFVYCKAILIAGSSGILKVQQNNLDKQANMRLRSYERFSKYQ